MNNDAGYMAVDSVCGDEGISSRSMREAGMDETKDELMEIVDLLTPDRYRRLGG